MEAGLELQPDKFGIVLLVQVYRRFVDEYAGVEQKDIVIELVVKQSQLRPGALTLPVQREVRVQRDLLVEIRIADLDDASSGVGHQRFTCVIDVGKQLFGRRRPGRARQGKTRAPGGAQPVPCSGGNTEQGEVFLVGAQRVRIPYDPVDACAGFEMPIAPIEVLHPEQTQFQGIGFGDIGFFADGLELVRPRLQADDAVMLALMDQFQP